MLFDSECRNTKREVSGAHEGLSTAARSSCHARGLARKTLSQESLDSLELTLASLRRDVIVRASRSYMNTLAKWNSQRRGRAGFTLIEILLVIVIILLLAGALVVEPSLHTQAAHQHRAQGGARFNFRIRCQVQ